MRCSLSKSCTKSCGVTTRLSVYANSLNYEENSLVLSSIFIKLGSTAGVSMPISPSVLTACSYKRGLPPSIISISVGATFFVKGPKEAIALITPKLSPGMFLSLRVSYAEQALQGAPQYPRNLSSSGISYDALSTGS
jgi:hypothetical protein